MHVVFRPARARSPRRNSRRLRESPKAPIGNWGHIKTHPPSNGIGSRQGSCVRVFIGCVVPSAESVLSWATAVANDWQLVAIVWHVALAGLLISYARGWRPSQRLIGV